MAIQNSESTIGFRKPYICGNCGYRISEADKLNLNRVVETVPVAGEVNTTIPLRGQSFVECPNCGSDLGRMKIR